MDGHGKLLTPKKMAIIAIFTAILFAQKEAFAWLPNIQLSQCLIAIYCFSFGFATTSFIVIIYVLLDSLLWGFNPIFTPAMIIAWLLLVLFLFLFKKFSNNRLVISIITGLHSIVYALCFAGANVILGKTAFISYLIADLPFTAILLVTGFVATFLLFDPLTKVLKRLYNNDKKRTTVEEK